MNYLLKLSLLLLMGIMVVSCTTEESNADEGVIPEAFGSGSIGSCLELVYPLTYEFSDGTTVEVASKEELREAKEDYKENNPDERAKAQLVFPVEVMTEEGETIALESRDALIELKQEECGSRKGRGGKAKCFTVVYPISYVTEDGTVITGETKRELRTAIKAWKAENPDATEKPSLQYPIEIINSDEETVEVASAEELALIKEDCKG